MKISPFTKSFNRAAFECGIETLDLYLKKALSQDIKKNAASGFILHEEESLNILGYYTLSAAGFDAERIPDEYRNQLPRYSQIPATLLGRLAISKSAQGCGLGEILLMDALQKSWDSRETIASWAVIVDAINLDARRFYEHFEFESLGDQEMRLFLPMKKIGKLFG